MEIVLAAAGPVGDRCREVLNQMGVVWRPLEVLYSHGADLLLSVHWRGIFKSETLAIPRIGALNLHNSYLPWGRGADAPLWAIVDRVPHGATLHWMTEGLDRGDVFYQERLHVLSTDNTDSLYKRTADLEVEVFRKGLRMFLDGDRTRIPQRHRGSYHAVKDRERLVRALTTSDSYVCQK